MRTIGHRARRLGVRPLQAFLRREEAGGLVLLAAVAVALVWANGPAASGYVSLWHHELAVGSGGWRVGEDLQHWVNDGLMTLFFFTVGLEIKRELTIGELRDRRAALLPVLAAVGGVAAPVAIFFAVARSGPAADAWGIPMATDIAFAVGVLALLGSRASGGAKLFLLSVAIVDDILAVLVVAIFYSDSFAPARFMVAVAALALMVMMRSAGVATPWAYLPVGVVAWLAMLESGVHATIAGVAIGLMTPSAPLRGRHVLEELERLLHPVSAFVVVPVFALANAGVDLRGGLLGEALGSRFTWAVVLGLAAGKLVGMGGAAALALRAGIGRLPGRMTTGEVWAVAALGGIGFTVALFVTDLALTDPVLVGQAKVGVFAGSLVSALLGAAMFLRTPNPDLAVSENLGDDLLPDSSGERAD